MNDVIKRHLLEELQVWPGVGQLEVTPLRFLSEAGIDLFFVVNIHFCQPNQHPGQDTEELQVGTCLPNLRWPTEQQPAGVEAVHTALSSVAVVHVAGPGHCPLPVVERLLS